MMEVVSFFRGVFNDTSKRAAFLFLLGAVCGMPPTLHAQSTAGTFVGIVRDSSGGVVPGASITLLNEATHLKRHTIANNEGIYEFDFVPPGTYTVSVKAQGFETYVDAHLALVSRQVLRINAMLSVGKTSTEVTVVAKTPVITTDTGTVAESQSAKSLTSGALGTPVMTSFGANTPFQSLVIRPGFSSDVAFKAYGNGPNGWAVLIDGNESNTSNLTNTVPYSALQEEADTVVGAPAEYRTPVTISGVTKGGTNSFHGSATLSFNQDALNALPATYVGERGPQLGHYTWNVTAGGPLYIPKVYDGHDRTFLFGSYEMQPTSITALSNGALDSVPTAAMRQGDFSGYLAAHPSAKLIDPLTGQPFPGGIIPQQRFDPAAMKALQNYIPAPNVARVGTDSTFQNYTGPSRSLVSYKSYFLRGDQKITNKNTLTASYTHSPYSSIASEGSAATITLPTMGNYGEGSTARQYMLSDTQIITPRILNEFGGSYNNNDLYEFGIQGQTAGDITDTMGINLGPDAAIRKTLQQAPYITISGLSCLCSTFEGDTRIQRTRNLRDNVSIQIGRHTIKTGWDYTNRRRDENPTSRAAVGQWSFTGVYTGQAVGDFLLGLPQTTQRFTSGLPFHQLSSTINGAYIQDNFKATSNLTVNVGVRFNWFSPLTELRGAQSNFDRSTGALVVPNQNSLSLISTGFPTDIPIETAAQANFPPSLISGTFAVNPRFGFAYRIGSRMVVRGSYGIFNSYSGYINDYFSPVDMDPFSTTETFNNQITNGVPLITLENPFPAGIGKGPSSLSVSGSNPNLGIPTMMQWNLEMQRRIVGNWVAKLGYVGDRTTGIWWSANIDSPPASTIPYSPSRAPYPLYQSVTYLDKGGNEDYNAFTAGLSHRSGNGLEFGALFNWVNDMTDVGNDGERVVVAASITPGSLIENPYCRQCDWSRNPYTPPLSFRANMVYALPIGRGQRYVTGVPRVVNGVLGGWSLASILDITSGVPTTVTFDGIDTSNTNLLGGRANLLSNCNYRSGNGVTAPYLNIACFAVPQNGTFGNASPGLFLTPSAWQVDLSAYKYFNLTEHARLRFNATLTNAFNHPTWSAIGTDMSTPSSFGQLEGEGAYGEMGPRVITLQAQISW